MLHGRLGVLGPASEAHDESHATTLHRSRSPSTTNVLTSVDARKWPGCMHVEKGKQGCNRRKRPITSPPPPSHCIHIRHSEIDTEIKQRRHTCNKAGKTLPDTARTHTQWPRSLARLTPGRGLMARKSDQNTQTDMPAGYPAGACCVQKLDVSQVLRFASRFASRCVLHRYENQMIPCRQLCTICGCLEHLFFWVWVTWRRSVMRPGMMPSGCKCEHQRRMTHTCPRHTPPNPPTDTPRSRRFTGNPGGTDRRRRQARATPEHY